MLTKYQEDLFKLAKIAWKNPEPGFAEFAASRSQVEYLRGQGFTVQENAAGTVTGYVASYGSGKPVIALLGEFDALYGLSQQADIAEPKPIPGQDMGQGCGHHLLGVGAIAAGLALRDMLVARGCSGTVRIYGCPAEESGSGKTYMAREGLFADCDAALTWHPSNYHMVCTGSSQSCIQFYVKFHGVAAHAAGAPHQGRSALDAAELMNIGVNYLREHMEDSDRVHYAVIDGGGQSPNVVQAEATLKYLVRSTTNPKCAALYERVKRIAQGAALMTDTKAEILFDEGLSNTVPNFALEDVLAAAFRVCGAPKYTPEEREICAKFKATFDLESALDNLPESVSDKDALEKNVRESELCDRFIETVHSDRCEMGSTDVGDVSWVVPTATINVNCYAYGADAHSWQWVAQGIGSVAMKGMCKAGEVLATAAARLLDDPARIETAKEELRRRLKGNSYICPIPADIAPHRFA